MTSRLIIGLATSGVVCLVTQGTLATTPGVRPGPTPPASSALPLDCNANGVDDAADIANGASCDLNENGVPDECERIVLEDCNLNGVPDVDDIASAFSPDCNGNGIPDECDVAKYVPLEIESPAAGIYAAAISNGCQVAGYFELSNGDDRAFRWVQGTTTNLGTLGGPHSWANGINDAGQVCGQNYWLEEPYDQEKWSVIWNPAGSVDHLWPLPGDDVWNEVRDISNGELPFAVGASDGFTPEFVHHACYWVVAGPYIVTADLGALPPEDDNGSDAYAISDNGRYIVGSSTDYASGTARPYPVLWDAAYGHAIARAFPGPHTTGDGRAVNTSGDIVGDVHYGGIDVPFFARGAKSSWTAIMDCLGGMALNESGTAALGSGVWNNKAAAKYASYQELLPHPGGLTSIEGRDINNAGFVVGSGPPARSFVLVPVVNGSSDCNGNGVPDECDLSGGASADCNANDVPDECEWFETHVCDPDEFSDGADISDAWEYVTLSDAATGGPVYAVASEWASSGDLVFSHTPGVGEDIWGEAGLRIDFAWKPTRVKIDMIADDDADTAGLVLYTDAGFCTSDWAENTGRGEWVTLDASWAAGIKYAIVQIFVLGSETPVVLDRLVIEGRFGDCNEDEVLEECQGCRGDTNCDGQIDFADINPFVDAIMHGIYCDTGHNSDLTEDCPLHVGFEDINPFADLLVQNPLPIICTH